MGPRAGLNLVSNTTSRACQIGSIRTPGRLESRSSAALPYPSCHRRVLTTPDAPHIYSEGLGSDHWFYSPASVAHELVLSKARPSSSRILVGEGLWCSHGDCSIEGRALEQTKYKDPPLQSFFRVCPW